MPLWLMMLTPGELLSVLPVQCCLDLGRAQLDGEERRQLLSDVFILKFGD